MIVALKTLPILVLAACAGPKLVNITGEGSKSMNRDAQGKPLSVVVHVHHLRNTEAFNRLTMEAMVGGKSETELLGNTLISSKEITLIPEENSPNRTLSKKKHATLESSDSSDNQTPATGVCCIPPTR
ncbi:type VI secretion system lipoprotein TssJ [Paludibacterium denitrificans]|uniref:type VI secretion system lipoprotein TssJ n=1 Tax=Paludibacterium denitrificans TaxID=2675226 RepID=UPI001E37EF1A|nr:type VI secretion system lipoprotein TssJ [Paludibacterium denitrificans]